jgi:hypothetical protein
MTWATVIIPGSISTHYFMGSVSLCLHGSLVDESINSRVRHATSGDKYCIECKTQLKSKKIHNLTQKQQRTFNLHQKNSEKFGKSLAEMLYNWLEYYSESRSVIIKDFEAFVLEEYRNVSFGAILILLLASKKIIISQGAIIPNFKEVSHVY